LWKKYEPAEKYELRTTTYGDSLYSIHLLIDRHRSQVNPGFILFQVKCRFSATVFPAPLKISPPGKGFP